MEKTTGQKLPDILVVDDDAGFRRQLAWSLAGTYDLREAADLESALRELRGRFFPLVLLDLHLSPEGKDLDGLDVLRWISRQIPETRVILLTGESDPQLAAETLRWGAWDFVLKPVDPEELLRILSRALRLTTMEQAGRTCSELDRIGGIVTANPEMARVVRASRQLAATRLPILILGPEGCGKTSLAVEILREGLPEGAPIRILPAGSIPEEWGEGAQGWVLEQVETLSAPLQARLEAQLDAEPRSAVSETVPRILATSRADLLPLARRGRFLPALARRFEMARLRVPSLAERPEDVPWIVRQVLAGFSSERNRPAPRPTPEAERVLAEMATRMEVRDLSQLLARAATRSSGAWISAEALLVSPGGAGGSLRTRRSRLEASVVSEALARHGGNVSHAARDLGVSRPTLHDLMRKHALDPSRFRGR
jgi:two-component system NtrC family response regulator